MHRYAHIGTGNYHPGTARTYTDLGLMTADPAVCDDVAHLFNTLMGYSRYTSYRRLLVAPKTMRRQFIALIQREIENALATELLTNELAGKVEVDFDGRTVVFK